MRRTERRYLVEDVKPLIEALHNLNLLYKTYHVSTLYLDVDPPTWSVGKGKKKYRARWYENNKEIIYFEAKGNGIKRRRKVSERNLWFGLTPVGTTEYLRHEYSNVDGSFRVTIDHDVCSPDKGLALLIPVVEIKLTKYFDTEWLDKLLPFPDRVFSKSKWVVGLC